MKKRIQKRTDHIHWIKLIRQDAITKQDRLMQNLSLPVNLMRDMVILPFGSSWQPVAHG